MAYIPDPEVRCYLSAHLPVDVGKYSISENIRRVTLMASRPDISSDLLGSRVRRG